MNHMDHDGDIGIVGMSCRLPGAGSVDAFWRNLINGVESITRLSDDEILQSGVPSSVLGNPSYVKAAPVLDEPGHFDAAFFGFSPMEARTMDPQHRLLLELAHEALEDAGYDTDRYEGRVGVFAGAAMNTYFMTTGLQERFSEDYIPTLIANDKDFLSTRVSYKLNLKGPSITVQTACSTSLVAIHLARQSLLSGETDLALAGAVSVRVPHRAGYFADEGGVVSPDGHVRAFDAKANGTVFGSGGGVLVLKRMVDALTDGDTIHAVIKGSAVNNDGAAKAGYTAPGVDSQAEAVVEALANAGVAAETIGYLEAHGSGTRVGDPIEVAALSKAFRSFTRRSGFCAIGSVKSNIGHLDVAAGIAGTIKTILTLKHRRIPPTLHYSRPNPEIDFPNSPFYVNAQVKEWVGKGPLHAGVMSTGMGGTNAHIVLEEAPREKEAPSVSAPRLLVLSARTETALDRAGDQLSEFLENDQAVDLDNVAYTLQVGRKAFEHRRCVVARDVEESVTLLKARAGQQVLSGRADAVARTVIFLFPGIGDHYVGMAHDLYATWDVFKQEVDRCAMILEPHVGIDIREVIYPANESWRKEERPAGIDLKKMLGRKGNEPEDPDTQRLNQTMYAQPALFTIEYALTRLWAHLGVRPDAMVGHSMGEYVAATLAGVLSLEDALRLIAVRARMVNELPRGSMLAVTMPERELIPLLREPLSISLINGPSLCVVAGPTASVREIEAELTGKGVLCRHVQNSHAFHSRMLDPIVPAFEREVRKVPLGHPRVPCISNVTGTWISAAQATDPAYWASHAHRTARFNDALHHVWQHENAVLVEVGPGRTLGVLSMQHPDRSHAAKPVSVASLRHHYEQRSDVEYFLESVGRLWVSGVEVDCERLLPVNRPRRIPLPTYPFQRQLHWMEPVRSAETAAATGVSVDRNPDMSRWYYLPSWRRTLPRPIEPAEINHVLRSRQAWLIFADELGFASRLATRLEDRGQRVVMVTMGDSYEQLESNRFIIDPGTYEHYERCVSALVEQDTIPDQLIHAWSLTKSESSLSDRDAFHQAQQVGFHSLVFSARAMGRMNVRKNLNLIVISNHVQEVHGDERLRPEKSTLVGPCLVIPQEYPNIRVKSVDVEWPADEESRDSCVSDWTDEIIRPDSESFVAYRWRRRWVQSHEPVVLPRPDRAASRLREGGVYLITGGLGNVGFEIARFLAGNYRARLILLGRSRVPARPSRQAPSGSGDEDGPSLELKARRITELEESGGEVLYFSADVADASALRTAIERGCSEFGGLHGVIHAAGIVGKDGYAEIKDSNEEICRRHFNAKVTGLCNLMRALGDKELDFCLLLSSLTAVLGGIGQSAYAAANAFMDSMVRHHNRKARTEWLSVNFDVWRLQDGSEFDDTGFGRSLQGLGMTSEEAICAVETVLAQRGAGQLIVSTGDLRARVAQWVKLESLGRDPGAGGASASSASRASQRPALSVEYCPPGNDTEKRIAEVWQEALGIDRIGIHDSFSELGGHSLLAIKIVLGLRRAFELDLPVRALFDTPTVAQLGDYITEQITSEISALSDEEARRLLKEP